VSTPTPRGINENDVWKAADALLLDGARPTIERVRQKIGRGSPNTVTPYLESWFRSLGARIADPMAFSSPPALPDPISEAAKHFWEAALAAARAEGAATLETHRGEFEAASRKLDGERAQLRIDVDRINAQLQAKEEAVELLRAHLSESQQRVEALSADLSARAQTIAELQSRTAQTEADREALRRQLEGERVEFETARRELAARETAHEERWAVEVDRAREAAKTAQTRVKQLEKELASRVTQMTQSLEVSAREHRRVTDLYVQSEAAVERLRDAQTQDAKMLADLQAKTREREATFSAQYDRVQTQLSDALAQLAVKDREHGELLRALVANGRRSPPKARRPRSPSSK
jgi:chromosome segregation ATPase